MPKSVKYVMHAVSFLAMFASTLSALESAKDDEDALQGTWTVISAEANGKVLKPKDLGIEQIVVEKKRITLSMQGKSVLVCQFTVDPASKPKAKDWIVAKKGMLPVIYAIEKNELKICFPLIPKEKKQNELLERPKSLDTKDKPFGLITAKKQSK